MPSSLALRLSHTRHRARDLLRGRRHRAAVPRPGPHSPGRGRRRAAAPLACPRGSRQHTIWRRIGKSSVTKSDRSLSPASARSTRAENAFPSVRVELFGGGERHGQHGSETTIAGLHSADELDLGAESRPQISVSEDFLGHLSWFRMPPMMKPARVG